MRATLTLALAALPTLGHLTLAQSPPRLNPVIELLQHRRAVFGVYAPGNRRAGANSTAVARTPAQLAQDARGYGAFPAFVQFTRAMAGAAKTAAPAMRLKPPLIVKTHRIAPDAALAAERIARRRTLRLPGERG